MMKRVTCVLLTVAAALAGASSTHAANPQSPPTRVVHMGVKSFTLHVTGTPSKGTTFWLAYGPLAGRFGVVRLRSSGHHLYSADVFLPTDTAGTFTYLAAQGTQVVHGTPQPGGIPIVIRTLSSVTAGALSGRVVTWSAPQG